MENCYKAMNEGKFDFAFAVEWMLAGCSRLLIATVPRQWRRACRCTALVDQFYSEVEKIGGKRWDTCSLLARLEHTDKK